MEAGLAKRLEPYSSDKEPFAILPPPEKGTADYKDYQRRRNNAQTYLKAISEQKCGTFKTEALSFQANTNLIFSSAATIVGGVGGLLSPESTAQALSVTSGALTGIQSHVSQNYYREKTFEIITKAIEVRRKTIWSDITAKQLRDTTEDNFSYTMNEAISDAIEYNNACSVIAGFEEISDSVESKSQDVDEAALLQKANIMIKPNANGIIETQGAPVSGVGTSNLSIDEILTIRR